MGELRANGGSPSTGLKTEMSTAAAVQSPSLSVGNLHFIILYTCFHAREVIVIPKHPGHHSHKAMLKCSVFRRKGFFKFGDSYNMQGINVM